MNSFDIPITAGYVPYRKPYFGIDLGPFNFDFNYTLGLNSFTKTDCRTSTHVTQFNLGWLF